MSDEETDFSHLGEAELTQEELDSLAYKIDSEGYDYAIINYMGESSVPDREFQEAREQYLAWRETLIERLIALGVEDDGW